MNNATTNAARTADQNLRNKLADARHAVTAMKIAHMKAAVAQLKR